MLEKYKYTTYTEPNGLYIYLVRIEWLYRR